MALPSASEYCQKSKQYYLQLFVEIQSRQDKKKTNYQRL